jgi:hypothetical protein
VKINSSAAAVFSPLRAAVGSRPNLLGVGRTGSAASLLLVWSAADPVTLGRAP